MVKAELMPYVIEAFYRSGLWKNFVFKGGTAIMLFYLPNFRKSVDLDFVIYEDTGNYRDLEYYGKKLKVLERHLRKDLFGEPKFYVKYGGIVGKIPITVVRGTTPQIKVDITYGKYNKLLLPPNNMELKNMRGVYARVMDLREIYAEKIRSLIQRTQIRDLYDVYVLSQYIGAEEIVDIVREKIDVIRKRGMTMGYDDFILKRNKFEKEYPRLSLYVLKLPDFGKMWEVVIHIFERLKEMEESEIDTDFSL